MDAGKRPRLDARAGGAEQARGVVRASNPWSWPPYAGVAIERHRGLIQPGLARRHPAPTRTNILRTMQGDSKVRARTRNAASGLPTTLRWTNRERRKGLGSG